MTRSGVNFIFPSLSVARGEKRSCSLPDCGASECGLWSRSAAESGEWVHVVSQPRRGQQLPHKCVLWSAMMRDDLDVFASATIMCVCVCVCVYRRTPDALGSNREGEWGEGRELMHKSTVCFLFTPNKVVVDDTRR